MKTPPPLPGQDIFLMLDGKQDGPYTLKQVVQMLSDGRVFRYTLAWHEGMLEWGIVDDLVQEPPKVQTISQEQSGYDFVENASELKKDVLYGRVEVPFEKEDIPVLAVSRPRAMPKVQAETPGLNMEEVSAFNSFPIWWKVIYVSAGIYGIATSLVMDFSNFLGGAAMAFGGVLLVSYLCTGVVWACSLGKLRGKSYMIAYTVVFYFIAVLALLGNTLDALERSQGGW